MQGFTDCLIVLLAINKLGCDPNRIVFRGLGGSGGSRAMLKLFLLACKTPPKKLALSHIDSVSVNGLPPLISNSFLSKR